MESCHFGFVCILYGTGGADMGRTTVGLYRAFSVAGKATCSLLAWRGVKGDKWLDWEVSIAMGASTVWGRQGWWVESLVPRVVPKHA